MSTPIHSHVLHTRACNVGPTILTVAAYFCLTPLASQSHADLVVPPGQTFVSSSWDDGQILNYGTIASDTAESFIFGPTTVVRGSGHFENTLSWGIFAPGLSPGITTGTNQAFAGTLEIELGGTTPGFGSGKHDQINDFGAITLDVTTSVLSILPYEGYVPSKDDEFTILTWTDGLDGSFSDVLIDSTFTTAGISFELNFTNVGGQGDLTLRAVAVPEAHAALGLLSVSVLCLLTKSMVNQHGVRTN